MSLFCPVQPALCNEAWFNTSSIYDDETYIDMIEAQAKLWKQKYESCGTSVHPIGKSSDLDGSQIEDEDDIVQEELGTDSDFEEASPDVAAPEPEIALDAPVDMTF